MKFFNNIFSVYNEGEHKVIKIIGLKLKFKNLTKKQTIPFLVYWVGTKCTLKCKLCCNLIPYTKQVSYTASEIIQDLQFLYDNADIKHLQIQGGEPFTHTQTEEIIDFANSLDIPYIELATNGTVLLKKNVLKALKRNSKINIRISNYSCADKQREQFINQLTENGIPYQIYDFLYGNNTWFSTGGVDEKKSGTKEVKHTYAICDNKTCTTLADGILSVCGKIATIKEIYRYKKHKPFDEINIRVLRRFSFSKKISRLMINLFLKNLGTYKEQCRYCKFSPQKYPAAEQLTKQELRRTR